MDSVLSIPWKNGGGITQQLAVAPIDATANDFLWRVSLARIDASGAFSSFPGIDRTILLWRGEGVILRSPSWPDQSLNDPGLPFQFRGEDEVVCELLGGPTYDLNLMVRRGQIDATLDVITEARRTVLPCDEFILLCASGSGEFVTSVNGETFDIEANQFLRASNVEGHQAVVIPDDRALLIGIRIRRLG